MEKHMVMHWLIVLSAAVVLTACGGNGEVDASTFAELLEARQQKDEIFKSGSDSPLPESVRDSFEGLTYFDPDTAFVIDAVFEPAVTADTFLMQTTSDDVRNAIRVGTFVFSINGNAGRLGAYQFVGSEHSSYFVPFKDATNGKETYLTGRYLDVGIEEDGSYMLDFNMAYNPYCAYNENYSCPLVPAENELPFAIQAGERVWH